MEKEFLKEWPCLGVEYLGNCAYNPLNPTTTYFSIGEAVAAFAVVLATIGIFNARHKIKVNVSSSFLRLCVLGLILSTMSSVVAALIPSFVQRPTPIVGYPIVWEVLGGLLSVFSIGSLCVWLIRPVRFNIKSSRRFLLTCYHTINRSDPEKLITLAEELSYSADEIVDAAGIDVVIKRYRAILPSKARQVFKSDAISILQLLSDKRFCRYAVAHCPSFAVFMLRRILGRFPNEFWGQDLVNQLIGQSILEKKSALRRESDNTGLGAYRGFKREVFGDYEAVTGARNPLVSWNRLGVRKLSPSQFHCFGKCIEEAFAAYCKQTKSIRTIAPIAESFQILIDSFSLDLRRETETFGDKPEWYTSDTFAFATSCIDVFRNCLSLLRSNYLSLPYIPPNLSLEASLKELSVCDAMGDFLFNYLEALSMCESGWRNLRDNVNSAWIIVDSLGSRDIGVISDLRVRDRFEKRVIERLRQNVEENGYFPFTRVMLAAIGVPNNRNRFLSAELANALSALLVSDLRPNYGPVNRLLPNYLRWIPEVSSFEWSYRPNRTRLIPFCP